jgi:phosphatidylglycerophosphatase A
MTHSLTEIKENRLPGTVQLKNIFKEDLSCLIRGRWERFMANTSFYSFMAQLGVLGKAPFAPGTVATIVAGIPCACVLNQVSQPWAFLLLVLFILASCHVAKVAEAELQRTDPREVVIDELAGFLITLFGFPITLQTLVLGVVSFRLLDIWKPWPVNWFQEKLKGGVAIVMDDVAAGILARALVWAGLKIWA